MKAIVNIFVFISSLFFITVNLYSQELSIDPQRFKTSPFNEGLLTTYSGAGTDSASYGIGVFFNYQPDSISLFDSEGNKMKTVVGDQLTANLSGFYSPLKWLDIGLVIPVIAYQNGTGWGENDDLPAGGIGDIRLVPRVQLYNFRDGLFAISLITEVSAPTGELMHKAMGRSNFSFRPAVGLSNKTKYLTIAMNFFYHLQEKQEFMDSVFNDEFGVKLAFTGKIIPKRFDIIGEFTASTSIEDPFKNETTDVIEVGGGFRVGTPVGMDFTAGASAGIGSAFALPLYRVFAGFSWNGNHKKEEKIEEKPEEKKEEKIEEKIEEKKEEKKEEKIEEKIEEKKEEKIEEKKEEKIEEKPEEKKEEKIEKAPQPKPKPKKVEKVGKKLQETIYFYENSARIMNQVDVEKVAMILTRNYTLKLRVEAHTDASEPSRLSRARGLAVEDVLVRNGVEQNRIEVVSIGSDEPVSTVDAEPDKKKNRRVEFYIITE